MESKSIKAILDEKLNYQNRNTRNALSEIFKDKIFTPVYDISLRNHKELAYDRLKKVMEKKPCSVKDFLTDPNNIFTMHEMVILKNIFLIIFKKKITILNNIFKIFFILQLLKLKHLFVFKLTR